MLGCGVVSDTPHLRKMAREGRLDAKKGQPLRNSYSLLLDPEERSAYVSGYVDQSFARQKGQRIPLPEAS